MPYKAFMYADDLAMFVSPTVNSLQLVDGLLKLFQGASGLACNASKSQLVPIHCTEDDLQSILATFSCQLVEFPVTYLGMPLSVYKLPW
jgi:hypothetical protein